MFTGFLSNQNYLYRENALFGLKSVAMYISHETIQKVANQLVDMSKTEQVPSVLVLILQTIHEFTQNGDDKVLSNIAQGLYTSLQEHPDSDVSFYAKQYSKQATNHAILKV